MKPMYSLFGFDESKHSVRTEVLSGVVIFLTMSYILAVNPLILSATGMDKGAVFSATVISAAVGTLMMALYAKLPFAQASSMGLNAFFAYTLVLMMGYSWQQALAAVFVEGAAFIILTIFKVREAVLDSIPVNLRYAISVGIGIFIAYIGLKNGGVIVGNDVIITTLGPWNTTSTLAAAGILLGAILIAWNVKGALFYTIIIMTIVGIPFGVTQIPENFNIFSMPASLEPIALQFDFSRFISLDLGYWIVVLTLLFMDLFNTVGTLVGAATAAELIDKEKGAGLVDQTSGKVVNMNKALMSDAVGTTIGALCGTSTVTTYVESATGIACGGRTGLTSFTVAVLFLLSLFLAPLFLIIPSAATTSALVIVGIMMLRPIMQIDINDHTELAPCFVTIIMMPLTSSISEGIVLGLLTWVIVKLFTGRHREISLTMYVLAIIFIMKYIANTL